MNATIPLDPATTVATSTDVQIVAPNSDKPEPSESGFSDAYNEDTDMANVKNGGTTPMDDDDYAMTFESDADEQSDRQEIQDMSQANDVSGTTKSLPHTVSATNLSSVVSNESTPPDVPYKGQAAHPPHHNLTIVNQTSDTMATKIDPTNSAQITTESLGAKSQTFDELTAGGIDIQQLLDNITANAEKPESPHLKNHSLPIHASLPPRPNVPQSRTFQDDGPKYYAGTPGLPPASTSYRPPGGASSIVAAGAPGTSTDPRGGLPPPPTASFRGPLSLTNPNSTVPYSSVNRVTAPQEITKLEEHEEAEDLETKWAPEVQKMYDEFLEDERRYVTEGLWDRFPLGSRLFIGNLPSEKVTKRDLFHIFHHYGKIAQISIKQAYGFVQFLHSDHCYKALDCEQGAEVRGRKMHLEISKPQKNTRNAQHNASQSGQRAKTPDRGRNNRNSDRYDRSTAAARNDDYGRPLRARDDYRPVRSVTPPRGNFRGRDSYSSSARDSFDARDRRRSRSPYGHIETGRYRGRSPSPRIRNANDDFDLQIPHRDPRDVPDVQIVLMEQLDRQFVSWVENEMRSRGVKVDVMFLSPRVPIEAVIRRQVLEGVHAVSKLDIMSQNSSKIPLRLFDRQGGANNIRFDDYQDLEPKVAAELVLRSKQKQQVTLQVQTPTYPQAQFYNQPYQAPANSAAPNLASLVGSLDNATLQKLLVNLSATQQQQNVPAAVSPAIDLAGLLGGLKQNAAPQTYVTPAPSIDHYSNVGHTIQNSFLTNNSQPPITQAQSTQPAQQVQNIMAQLARYRNK